VVLAAGGYPNDYHKGDEISGLESSLDGKVFHAGTVLEDNKVLTNGGRVLAITTLGETVRQAQQKAYEINSQISYADKYCRSDIGYRAVARES
jgi:phosphoribosylamine--glycine ligase